VTEESSGVYSNPAKLPDADAVMSYETIEFSALFVVKVPVSVPSGVPPVGKEENVTPDNVKIWSAWAYRLTESIAAKTAR